MPQRAKGPFDGFYEEFNGRCFGGKEAGNAALVGWSPVMRHPTQSNHRARFFRQKIA